MLKKLAGHFGIYGISPFIPGIAMVFVLPIITPHLSREDFGVYGLVMAYVGFAQIAYSLGLSVNLSNSFFKSRSQYKWLWRQLYGFWIIWSLVYVVILSALLFLVIPHEAVDDRWAIIVSCILPIVFFGPAKTMCNLLFQFKKMSLQVGLRNIVGGLLTASLLLLFIAYLKLGYLGWFYAVCLSGIVINLSYAYPFWRRFGMTPIFNFKRRTIKQALKVALPVVPHQNASFLLDSSDRIVMNMLSISTAQIGLYNAAYTATTFFQRIGGAVTNTVRPFVIEMIRDKQEDTLRDLFFFLQFAFFLMVLAFAALSKELTRFLLNNEEFYHVYPLASLLVASTIIRPMYMANMSRLFYFEKTKSLAIYSFIAGIINVGLNFLLIPYFGIEVAAITTIVGFLFLAYSRFWTQEYREVAVLPYYPLAWLLSSIVVVGSCYYLSIQAQPIRYSAFTGVLAAGLYLLYFYSKRFAGTTS